MPSCQSCGKPIRWTVMPSGKKAPFDTCEVPFILDDSSKILALTPDGKIVKGRTCSESDEENRYIYASLSHFSTCQKADQHRRKE